MQFNKRTRTHLLSVLLLLFLATGLIAQVRVKDTGRLAGLGGIRLIGYGLVVGLDRSGDSQRSLFTNQSLANMLERFGLAVDGEKVRARNVAAVMVTADIPPFSRAGNRFNATVSSMGDAKSLQGGVLLQTTLSDIAGEVWAVAAGPLTIGGFNIETGLATVRRNHPLVGLVPNGGKLERDTGSGLIDSTRLTFILRQGDFTTARRMAEAINLHFGAELAAAVDAASIDIAVPDEFASPDRVVTFIAELESIEFEPDIAARVVINERTGTIVIGENVSLSSVAVSHGPLAVTIRTTPLISQPMPFARGETRVEQYQEVTVEQIGMGVVAMPAAATVGDIATALNSLGVTPRDIIAIFQALKESGALRAELVII